MASVRSRCMPRRGPASRGRPACGPSTRSSSTAACTTSITTGMPSNAWIRPTTWPRPATCDGHEPSHVAGRGQEVGRIHAFDGMPVVIEVVQAAVDEDLVDGPHAGRPRLAGPRWGMHRDRTEAMHAADVVDPAHADLLGSLVPGEPSGGTVARRAEPHNRGGGRDAGPSTCPPPGGALTRVERRRGSHRPPADPRP